MVRLVYVLGLMLPLLLVSTMMGFVWHTELYMVARETGGYFTNGFWNSNPTQVYHVWMYQLWFVTIANSLFTLILITRNNEIVNTKGSK